MGYVQEAPTQGEPFEPRIGRSMSLDQACEILQVSRRTVYNWIREGRLRTIRTIGGSQRVLVDSVRQVAGRARSLNASI